ncbi:MAG TPA: hypothetical protein VMW38_17045 [Terriglobia bacterium]|nr:hypothetical protein [Terriglobia bacterium]
MKRPPMWEVTTGTFSHRVLEKDCDRAALAAFMKYPIPSTLGFLTAIRKIGDNGKYARGGSFYTWTGNILEKLGIEFMSYGRKQTIRILPCESIEEVNPKLSR